MPSPPSESEEPQLIDTIKPEEEEEDEKAEDFADDAQGFIASALQLMADFCAQKEGRRPLFLFLEIDSLVRRAEIAKHVSDFEYAISDFEKV